MPEEGNPIEFVNFKITITSSIYNLCRFWNCYKMLKDLKEIMTVKYCTLTKSMVK